MAIQTTYTQARANFATLCNEVTANGEVVNHRDYPTVQAIVCVMALVFLSVNLLIDLLYA